MKDALTEWQLLIGDLGEYPENFKKIIRDLEAEIALQPHRDDLYFLMAKIWEFYPTHVGNHHEQFAVRTIKEAYQNYGKAIDLSAKPEYFAAREALATQFPWLLEQSIPVQTKKDDSRYYRHSGKTEPVAFLYVFTACLTAIPLLAFVYAFMCDEITYPIIKLAIPAVFAFLTGAALNMAIVGYGKTRNGLAGFLLAVAATVWAYWLQWIFYFVYMAHSENGVNLSGNFSQAGSGFFNQVLFLLQKPGMVWHLIQNYIAVGHWRIFGVDINGSLLGFVLIVEFLVIFLVSVFVGFANYDKPFDEVDKKWFKYEFLQNEKYFLPEEQLVAKLENQQYAGILTPNRQELEAAKRKFSKYTLFSNGSRYFLSVENVIATLEKAKWKENSEELVQYISITPEFAAELKSKNKNVLEDYNSGLSNMNYYKNLEK